MSSPKVAPYGSWKSPISSDLIASANIGFAQIAVDSGDTYWLETRPAEGGRHVIVKKAADGLVADLTPPTFNARTRVHEYGGGSYTVADGQVYFINYSDQKLYAQEPGAPPRLLAGGTQVEATASETALRRYADMVVDRKRQRLLCVCEDHTLTGQEAVNSIVSVSLSGDSPAAVLVSGNDFYASPRLSPDGARLAWLTWNHPNMPWDETQLWVADLSPDGSLGRRQLVAGGPQESVVQPEWSPDGVLHFVSERTGWWNLYRFREGRIEALCSIEAEFARPAWLFAYSSYAFAGSHGIICAFARQGTWNLALLDEATGRLAPIETGYVEIMWLKSTADRAVFRGGSPGRATAIVELDLKSLASSVLASSSSFQIEPEFLSAPQAIEFPTEGGLTAHGFFYRPGNQEYRGPADEKPPLIVKSHGGPTGCASCALDPGIQFWTSRGFAVLDVNYGGSTGFGRAYRQRLDGQWGVVDVDDCLNGALYLVERGEVDGNRLLITGGSAGGYTTLCALTFRHAFRAGASHFGIGDLEAMVRDTHKFEARYLDRLVGPYPDRRDIYLDRSPICHVERLSCPVIFFQGLEDKIVLPNQAEMMVDALRQKGVPVAYVAFEGEQHGFRRAENIRRALDGELYFYSRVCGFGLAEPVDPVSIENL